jgi:hypothetical protein
MRPRCVGWILTHVFAVTSVIGSTPVSAAQELLALRFKVAVFSVLSLGDQRMRISDVRKIGSEKSFVGSRAVPYHDAELITYNYNPAT